MEDFKAEAKNWIETARHPRWNHLYTELVYQPMLVVLRYLRANAYKTDVRLCAELVVGGVILMAFDVGLHVGRWHQSHGVAKCLELARPMMRRGAGLDADQAWTQLLEERKDVATLQLTADDQLASTINAMHLEHRFGNVETDCRDVCMFGSSKSWSA